MTSYLNNHRFEYIWHLINNNLTDIDIPFADHIPCDPAIWQYPQHLIEYNKLIFEQGREALQDKNVLDIGCGVAWYLGSLEGVVKKYTGIEPDSKSVKYAKIMSNLVNVDAEIKLANAEQIACSADTIMMLSVTQYIKNVKPIFEKFDCKNIILDCWEKHTNSITLDELITHVETLGFVLNKKTVFIDTEKPELVSIHGDRYILHFHS